MIGINLSGAEFGGSGMRHGYDYIYPSTKDLDFYESKGVELIRLPFKWERMQTSIGGELNEAELGRMKNFLAQAEDRGMEVIVDLHNYGRYGGAVIGSAALPTEAFADFWVKLAGELKDQGALRGYDIMNEPHGMGGASVWPTAAQAAVDAIRTVDTSTAIYVEGDGWANAHNWSTSSNANLHIQDPANNIVYEAHLYFDKDKSGTYKNGYDQEGAYPNIGVDRAQSFLDWLDANDYKGFIGEFSVPDNDPRWLTVLENFLTEVEARGVDAAYWGAGPWWGDYPMALRAPDGSANPQLDVLDDYFVSESSDELAGGLPAQISFGNGGNSHQKALVAEDPHYVGDNAALGSGSLHRATAGQGEGSLPVVGSQLAVEKPWSPGTVDTSFNVELNALQFDVAGSWNSVKNILVESDTAANIAVRDFVHADVYFGGSGHSSVFVSNAKRGNVDTGSGNDTVSISLATNNAGWQNTFHIDSGAGNDSISLVAGTETGMAKVTDGRHTTVVIDAGAGNDTIDLSGLNLLAASIAGGAGDDKMTGSNGSDTYVYDVIAGGSNGRDLITNFVLGQDNLQLDGGLAVVLSAADTEGNLQVKLTDNTVITFQGVSLNELPLLLA
jgi:aryl-phospho-beta-D-glucosidase BglC (GH1 family)